MQKGVIKQRGASWVLRCNEKVIENGKEVWKSKTIRLAPVGGAYRTAASVQELADEALAKLQGTSAKPTSTEDFERFLDRKYLPHIRREKAVTTAKTYAALLKLLRPHLGKIELRELRSSTVARILEALKAAKPHLVQNTLTKCKRFLSSAWKHAKTFDLVDGACPVDAVKTPKGQRNRVTHAYTLEEVRAIYDTVPVVYKAMISIFAFCGLRLEEVKGLKWEDFDGENLHVRRVVVNGGTIVEGTKTEASAAPVPCNEEVIADLKRHRAKTTGNGFIFHGRDANKPLRIENDLRRVLRPLFKKAGIVWHGWHAFRRGTATTLHEHGTDDKTIQGVLRHSEQRTTQNIYIKTNTEAAREAMGKVRATYKGKVVSIKKVRKTA